MKKVVLAYSGGLDTTYCALYLSKELGYEVHAAYVNTGGADASELKAIEERAKSLGINHFVCLDEEERYYHKIVRYLIYGNVLKNETYPLSVSAERIAQAVALAAYVKDVKADAVAHGSTGAGNDQLRFDMALKTLVPGIEIITPIRDQKLSREAEIAFLKSYGVEMNFEKAKYSINKGLWGTSVGGAETLRSDQYLPESAWPTQIEKTESESLRLGFVKGELRSVNGKEYSPVEAIQLVSNIAAPFGIGRDIHVGDTVLGIKGRVGFEAAAPLIIIKAHHLLEKHTLTKWQLNLKSQQSLWYGNLLHEGCYLEPAMRDLETFLESTQTFVSGTVFVKLHPYRFVLEGIESPHDLMSSAFGAYGEMNNTWSGEDVKGFTKIFGNQSEIFYQVNTLNNPYDD